MGLWADEKSIKRWWEAAKEAGTINQPAVVKALEHGCTDQAPGGPAEMVPGQHHLRLNMYIAQARNGKFKVVKNLGVIDPKETSRSVRHELSAVG